MEGTATTNLDKIPESSERHDFEIWAGIGVPIVILGTISNAFFFISVALAMKKSRHGFGEERWKWLLLLNVAAVDFLYCMNYWINGMIGLAQVPRNTIPGLCKFLVLSRSDLSAVDGWCIAAFAFNVAFPNFW